MIKPLPKFWARVLREASLKRPINAWRFWFSFAVLIVALNLYAPGSPTLEQRILASLIFFTTAVAIYTWSSRRAYDAAFLPMFGINFSINYGLGVFLLNYNAYLGTSPFPALSDTYNEVLVLSLAGLLMIIIAYKGPWWRRLTPHLPHFRLCWQDAGVIEFVACSVGLISLVFYWISFRQSLPPGLRQPFAIASNVFLLCMILLLILHFEQRLSFMGILLLYGVLIPVRVLLGMSQGFLAPAIVVGLAMLMTYATVRRRIPWLMLVVGFAGFSILQPVKASLRSQVWMHGNANREQDEGAKMAALVSAAQLAVAFTDTFGYDTAVSLAVERLSQLVLFQKVVDNTPSNIPYWDGETYYPFLFKPIPRALWPDKPDETRANEFGHRYGVIGPDDYSTAINLPQLVEFYGNFGPLGVLIGCFLVGMIYRFVHDIFIHETMGIGGLASGLFILSLWLDQESNLSLVMGGIVGMIVTIVGINFVMTALSNTREALRRAALAADAGANVRHAPQDPGWEPRYTHLT